MGTSSWLASVVAWFAVAIGGGPEEQKESELERSLAVIREELGVELAVLQSKIRRRIISTDSPYGFLIRRVERGSLAERCGLEPGDILLRWDGEAIREVEPLAEWIARADVSRTAVPIFYARKRPGVPLTFPATDPWEDRRTRLRFDRDVAPRRSGPV